MREGRKTCPLRYAPCRVELYVWAENGLICELCKRALRLEQLPLGWVNASA